MLSQETLERYRQMTPSERLAITFEMIRDAAAHLTSGPPDVVDRRFELIRKQNDERTANMLAGMANPRTKNEGPLRDS